MKIYCYDRNNKKKIIFYYKNNNNRNSSSLIQLLEKNKIFVHSQCRSGFCGTCRISLISGKICYFNEPLAYISKKEILSCCCIPISDIIIKIENILYNQ